VRHGAVQRSVPVAVLDGRVRAGANQRGRCIGVGIACSQVQRRAPAGTGGTGGGLIHPDRNKAAPTAKGPPVVVLNVQRCAGVDERMDGRQIAVGRRIVQRRPPIPVQARAAEESGTKKHQTERKRRLRANGEEKIRKLDPLAWVRTRLGSRGSARPQAAVSACSTIK
jgi:hypothetical protein